MEQGQRYLNKVRHGVPVFKLKPWILKDKCAKSPAVAQKPKSLQPIIRVLHGVISSSKSKECNSVQMTSESDAIDARPNALKPLANSLRCSCRHNCDMFHFCIKWDTLLNKSNASETIVNVFERETSFLRAKLQTLQDGCKYFYSRKICYDFLWFF